MSSFNQGSGSSQYFPIPIQELQNGVIEGPGRSQGGLVAQNGAMEAL
jgi:hypothetical protein